MSLKESGEMYLETIYILSKKSSAVRSVDIAEYMNYTRASVSRGVGLLKKHGLIDVDKNGFVTLTVEGMVAAKKIMERHEVLTDMLVRLGIDEATAAKDACRMEHVISDETFHGIKEHYAKYNK
ncbi:MAG: metal-dependent transcriptional regulator [Eubacteriales bacterium]